MAEVSWIKVVVDIFDNRKLKQIENLPNGDAILVVWFKLLCLAGCINRGGRLVLTDSIPYTVEMLSTELRRSEAVINRAVKIFTDFGMLIKEGHALKVANWEKYQNVRSLDSIREQTRLRNVSYRERRKAAEAEPMPPPRDIPSTAVGKDAHRDVTMTSRVTSHDVMDCVTEEPKEPAKPRQRKVYGLDYSGVTSPMVRDALAEFAEYRKKTGHPMTQRALELLIGKLEKLGRDDGERVEILQQSILQGWQGIFALKPDKPGATYRKPSNSGNFEQRDFEPPHYENETDEEYARRYLRDTGREYRPREEYG